MDLRQRKLNKSEWESIEIQVSDAELDILHLIIKGYHDVMIRINKNNSIFTYLKIEFTEKMETLKESYFKNPNKKPPIIIAFNFPKRALGKGKIG